MLERFKREEITPLDVQIARVIEEMGTYGPGEPEYKQQIKYLERLHALKAGERQRKVSAETLWKIAGNILIVLVIVSYERSHVMTTRAKDFIVRMN